MIDRTKFKGPAPREHAGTCDCFECLATFRLKLSIRAELAGRQEDVVQALVTWTLFHPRHSVGLMDALPLITLTELEGISFGDLANACRNTAESHDFTKRNLRLEAIQQQEDVVEALAGTGYSLQ